MMAFEQFFEAATGHAPYDYQWRMAEGNGAGCCQSQPINVPASERNGSVASLEKGNVGRRNIQEEDSESLECVQHPLHSRPARLELLPLLRLPIRPNLLGKLRPRI